MSERRPPESGFGTSGENKDPFFGLAAEFEADMKAVEWENMQLLTTIMDKRETAVEADSRLTQGETNPLITKRYRIAVPGGNPPKYPFSHERVVLKPKADTPIANIVGAVLRFAYNETPNRQFEVTDTAVITLAFRAGIESNYLISTHEWAEIDSTENLLIKDNRLLGLRSDFEPKNGLTQAQLNSIIASFEPEPQTRDQ